MAKVCIICEKETGGKLVMDDFVITLIRKVKTALSIAKNNTLVVCQGCMEAYSAKRTKYERDLVVHAIVGGMVLLLFVLLPLFTTGFSIASILLGLVLFALIMALSVFSHCPKVEDGGAREAAEKKKAKGGKKS
jgi:hypothetical protein